MRHSPFNNGSETAATPTTEEAEKKSTKKSTAESVATILKPQIEQPAERPKSLLDMFKDKPKDAGERPDPVQAEDDAGIAEKDPFDKLDGEEKVYAGEKIFEASPVAEDDPAAERIEHFRRSFVEHEGDTDAALADTSEAFGFEAEAAEGEASEHSVAEDAGEDDSAEVAVETAPDDTHEDDIDQTEATGQEPPVPVVAPATPPGVAPNAPLAPPIAPPTPPHGPNPPAPPTPPGGGQNFNIGPPNPNLPNPNVAPAVAAGAAANQLTQQPNVYVDNSNTVGAALLGGIVGYLIGKRRGRKKAERRFRPVKANLEKQVTELQQDLQTKEQVIRTAAVSQQRKEHWNRKAQSNERAQSESTSAETSNPTPTLSKVAEAAAAPISIVTERETTQGEQVEATAELQPKRLIAPEAVQLHSMPKATEQIGQMLVGAHAEAPIRPSKEVTRAEAPSKQAIEQQAEKQPAQKPEKPTEKHVETMNRAELMALADKITVNGSTLRQVYETHLIGERGLRRLVAEHLRGGDVNKALRREIVEREIDFERDPAMRDQASASPGSSPTTSASLQKLIEQAGAAHSNNEEVAFLKARAEYELQQKDQHDKRRHMIDAGFVGAILLLSALVAVLVITRL